MHSILKSRGFSERVIHDVLGGYAAENRGADFVQHLVLSPCARTRHWTRLRFSEPQGASTLMLLRCSRVSAAISVRINEESK